MSDARRLTSIVGRAASEQTYLRTEVFKRGVSRKPYRPNVQGPPPMALDRY